MRCGCSQCGVYMAQRDEGLGCVCPNCLSACVACMGGEDAPVSRENLTDIYASYNLRKAEDEE